MGNSDLTSEDLTRWQNISHEWLLSDEATKTSIILKITNFAPANSIKFSKIHSSPGRIRGHATTGQAGCRLFDEHDTQPRPGYFCIFTQCQRGFFTPNIIGTGHCLRQNRRAGAALKYSVNLDYRVDYISQVILVLSPTWLDFGFGDRGLHLDYCLTIIFPSFLCLCYI